MAEIKISELSIGDWVRMGGGNFQIYLLALAGDVYGYRRTNDSDTGEEYYDGEIGDVEPIPLTPEILEKNGFVKNGEYNEWNIGNWNTPYLLGVSLERPAITIKWNGSSIFIDQAKYVHQLQHALRLAGVEKEIEV